MRRRMPLVAILLLFVLPPAAPAAPETGEPPELRGTVTGPEGKPVEGATVRVLGPAPSPAERPPRAVVVTTGADGKFLATGLTGFPLSLRVEAPGLAPHTRHGIEPGDEPSIRLAPGHALGGRVLDRRSGGPVPVAEVRACDSGHSRFGRESCRSATTGDDGRFRLAALAEGAHDVEALSPAHARRVTSRVAVPPARDPETGKPAALELFLVPGGRISGKVVDAEGGPVEGARVAPTLRSGVPPAGDGYPRGHAEWTDERGGFDLRGVPAGASLYLILTRDGFVRTEHGPLAIEPGEHRSDLRVVLRQGATVTFRLVDEEERPVREFDAWAEWEPVEGRAPGGRAAIGDIDRGADGRHALRNLTPGRVRLVIYPEDFDEVVIEELRLREGGARDLGTLVLKPGHRIAGLVVDAEDEPVARASVEVSWMRDGDFRQRRKVTDQAGRFRVSGLDAAAQAWMRVTARGFVDSDRFEAPVDGDEIRIEMVRTATVTGRVLLPGGEPAPAFTVEARSEAGDAPSAPSRRLTASRTSVRATDDEGRFSLEGVAPGAVTVEASAEGWAPGRKTGVSLHPGDTVDVGTIRLREGIVLRGRVVEAAHGTGVPGAALSARPGTGGSVFGSRGSGSGTATTADAQGAFELRGLEPGPLEVRAEHPEFSSAAERVELAEGAIPDDLLLRLSQGGRLAGVVIDRDGAPVAGERILAIEGFASGDQQDARTGDDGRYAMERLTPGSYVVARLPEDGRPGPGTDMRTATIREGETTVVDFIDRARIRLAGRVLRGGDPVGDASLTFLGGPVEASVLAEGVRVVQAATDPAGRYEVGLEEPGEYRVMVIRQAERPPLQSGTRIRVPDEPEVALDIVLPVAGLAGTVSDADGRPVQGAIVQATREGSDFTDPGAQGAGTADGNGRYRIDGLGAGSYRVRAMADGYAAAQRFPVEVADATVEVDLVLERGRRLRGRVTDARGRPVPGALVLVGAAGTGAAALGGSTQADLNGVFEISVPSSGTTDLTAIAEGWAPGRAEAVAPGPDPAEVAVEIVLTAGGRIRVRVVDASGAPAPGVQVVVRGTSSPVGDLLRAFRPPATTGPDGTALVELLAPGAYEVGAAGHSDVPPVQVTVQEGQETAAVLRLP